VNSAIKANRRRTLFLRFDGLCHYCGVPTALDVGTIDHKTPKSRGGTDTYRNLAWSCSPCNTKKADRTAAEYFLWLQTNSA